MPSFLHALDTEWAVVARSPASRRALTRWAMRYPALEGLGSLEELLEARRDPARAQGLLAVLAELAPTDDLATRTLLQALLPGLVCLAGRVGKGDPQAIEELVSLAWERIRTYPRSRRGAVAGNVLLDVRKRYRQHRMLERPASAPLEVDVVDAVTPETVALARMSLERVAAARRAGVVSAQTMRWIVRTRVMGEAIEDVAAEDSIPHHTALQRRWRAECRLRDCAEAG